MNEFLHGIYDLNDTEMDEYNRNVMLGGGTPGPCIVGGKGVRVTDSAGKRYIDCTSQSWALYLGFANDEITETVHEHMRNMSHIHQGFTTKPRASLANRLASIAPPGMSRVSFTVGGSPAIEAAMKIACKNVDDAHQFIVLWDAYHGTTMSVIGSSWVTSRASGRFMGNLDFINGVGKNFVKVPNPYCYRCPFGKTCETCSVECAEFMRQTFLRGTIGPVAGVIMEVVQASGGQIIAPLKYVRRVREICDEFGCLLIFDEIQTYMRIGDYFAATLYGVTPDVIVLGKALGAGLPIAAIIIRDGLKGFSMRAEELHTFANNSASQIAAIKLIDIIERDKLLDNTRETGAYLKQRLEELSRDFPEIGDIRQIGLHIGVEMVGDPVTKKEMNEDLAGKIKSIAMSKGLILGTAGFRKHILKIKPALIVNKEECDEIAGIFADTLKTALR